MNKIVLLDRDGTVIVDPPDERVDKIEKIELFPDTIEALKVLADAGFSVILITNQAGIAEGRINKEEFQVINNRVLEMLQPSGVEFLETFVCPHGPNDGCECRKPKPTMILRAAEKYGIDLANTFMVGDRPGDIGAGNNAGTKTILVKTGNVDVEAPDATYTASTLLDAARYIVTH